MKVDNTVVLVVDVDNTVGRHSYAEAHNSGFLDHKNTEDTHDENPMKMNLNDVMNSASNSSPLNYYPPSTQISIEIPNY